MMQINLEIHKFSLNLSSNKAYSFNLLRYSLTYVQLPPSEPQVCGCCYQVIVDHRLLVYVIKT